MRRAREELPEEGPCKRGNVIAVLRRERGQVAGPCAGELPRGVAKVVEETGRIRIVGVDLIPDGLQPARLQISGGQRRLAGSRRPGDPHDRPAGRPIEACEQRFAIDNRTHDRLRRFRECCVRAARLDHFVFSLPTRSSHALRSVPMRSRVRHPAGDLGRRRCSLGAEGLQMSYRSSIATDRHGAAFDRPVCDLSVRCKPSATAPVGP